MVIVSSRFSLQIFGAGHKDAQRVGLGKGEGSKIQIGQKTVDIGANDMEDGRGHTGRDTPGAKRRNAAQSSAVNLSVSSERRSGGRRAMWNAFKRVKGWADPS